MTWNYTCAMCGGDFASTWSKKEALAETERDFGAVAEDDRVQVCDDCYQTIRPDKHPKQLELWKEQQKRGFG